MKKNFHPFLGKGSNGGFQVFKLGGSQSKKLTIFSTILTSRSRIYFQTFAYQFLIFFVVAPLDNQTTHISSFFWTCKPEFHHDNHLPPAGYHSTTQVSVWFMRLWLRAQLQIEQFVSISNKIFLKQILGVNMHSV